MATARLTLDELVRRVREIPSPEGRLFGRKASVAFAEQQLAVARQVEPVRLRRRMQVTSAHPSDERDRIYDLEVQLTHLLPKLFRGGSLLAIWSILEACTKDLAAYAAKVLGKQSPLSHFRGPFIAAAEKAFSSLSIAPFESSAAREQLVLLAAVRASIVHHNSELRSLPRSIDCTNQNELARLGLYVESDIYHDYFVPTPGFVSAALLLVDTHLRSLATRVKEVAPPPPRGADDA